MTMESDGDQNDQNDQNDKNDTKLKLKWRHVQNEMEWNEEE